MSNGSEEKVSAQEETSPEELAELELMRRHCSELADKQPSNLPKEREPTKACRTSRVLQNTSWFSNDIPTIRIEEGEPEWKAAHDRWLVGKNPTDSTDWRKGVFLHFRPIEHIEQETNPFDQLETPSGIKGFFTGLFWWIMGLWMLAATMLYSCFK